MGTDIEMSECDAVQVSSLVVQNHQLNYSELLNLYFTTLHSYLLAVTRTDYRIPRRKNSESCDIPKIGMLHVITYIYT
jgi:rRNA pseudouridine-1189 N-methylase Emg1 (Nep1/Mra1 family)